MANNSVETSSSSPKAAKTLGEHADAILDATMSCVERLGFGQCRMEDIAAASGVSRATLYRRFRNREEIFDLLLARCSGPFVERGRAIASGPGSLSERIEAILLLSTGELGRHEWLQPMLRQGVDEFSFEIIARADAAAASIVLRPMLEAGIAAGEVTTAVAVDELLRWMLRQVLQIGGEHRNQAEARQRIRSLILPAVATPPAEPGDRLARIEARIAALEARLAMGNPG